ncbi:MAG: hypothetical protein JO257_27175 [Deltaproteobacteria bacterium]|nr:hypothetical protein [Deltaproteobacteria bacterium]
MTRLASIVLALLTLATLSACDKPTPEDCRKALLNMQHLLGTENLNTNASIEGEVRRCRGGSKRKAVACAIKATTLDELRACDFEKVPGKAPLGGSAAGSAAMTGGAPVASPPGGTPVPVGSAAVAPAGGAVAPAGSAVAPAGSATSPAGSASGSAK